MKDYHLIPKKIHYCWFGNGNIPDLVVRCIASWNKHASEYEVILWNESNFDIQSTRFTSEAYKAKKYAFVTDYVRLKVLHEHGGIYLDSDVELIGNIDEFLNYKAFSGFEDNNTVPTGIMGAQKGSHWIQELLKLYESKEFTFTNGRLNLIPNTKIITEHAISNGLELNNSYQEVANMVVFFPSEYFCPKSHYTGKIMITDKTKAIHHFNGSWLSPYQKAKRRLSKVIIKTFGFSFFSFIKSKLK